MCSGWSSAWDVVSLFVGLLLGQLIFGLFGGRLIEKKLSLLVSSLLVVVGTLLAIIPDISNLVLGFSRMLLGIGASGKYCFIFYLML